MNCRGKHSGIKVLTVLLVYSLHLFFLQALMVTPDDFSVENFKEYFSKNQTTKHAHPPATHFYQLHKHDSKQAYIKVSLPPVNFDCSLLVNHSFSSYIFSTQRVTPEICSRIVNVTSQRYRTCGVLLI